MTTELEKTQLEIARLQLEQDRHKLAGLQMRQKVVNNLAQGAVAVGGAVGKGGSTLLRYVGRWLTWALVVETCIVVLLGAATLFSPSGLGFWWDLGVKLGSMHAPNLITVFGVSTILAFFPFAQLGGKEAQGILGGLGLCVFLLWKYFWV